MSSARALAVAALLSAAAAFRVTNLNRFGVTPVTELNATKYLGRWYQTYADAVVMSTFEANNNCVTADYGVNPNGTISVHNRARIGSPSGPESQIYGYAVPPSNGTAAGEFTVYLQGVPVGAPYWVFGLGPATYGNDGMYQYALVSDSLNLSLFVLARNVTDYMATYDAEVQATLKSAGFTNFLNTPILTVQSNCTYW